MDLFSKNATVVLVHGAWADGSSWNRVILPLLWRSRPSWFLIAEEDRMISPKTQRFMAERMAARIRVHRVDHTPLFTAPEVVIDIINEAARETLTC